MFFVTVGTLVLHHFTLSWAVDKIIKKNVL